MIRTPTAGNREAGETPDFLAGGGEMGELIRAHDWASTPLGPPEMWPQPLRTAIRLLLNTGHPMYVWWGPALRCFYNDAYRQSIGPERHPGSLGRPAREVWDEIWDIIGPQIDQVMAGGGATWQENHLVPITRNGRREDVYWTYSYGPIDDPGAPSGVGGVLVVCTETTKQVLAERRHRAEQERLTQMFAQAPGFTALLRGPDHVFELTNPAYVQLVGHRDVIGKPVREALPEVEGQGFFELLDRVYASGKAFVATGMSVDLQRTPDSPVEQRFVDFVYQPVTDGGRVDGIFVQGADVTERRHAEERLRDSEARLRTIFENTTDFIVVTDLDQRITACNPAAAAALGYAPDEVVGRSIKDFVGEAEFEKATARLRAKLAGGSATRYELTIYDRQGAPRLWEINSSLSRNAAGKPIGLHVLGRDMTEARAAQTALAASEARLRRAQEAGGVGSYEWDLATGDGQHSDSMLRIAGLEPGRSYTLKEILAPVLEEDMPQVRATIAAIAEGVERRETDYRLRRPSDGAVRWIRDIGQVERDANGRPVRWVGIIQDVTDRKTAEIELRERAAELEAVLDAVPAAIWIARDPEARHIDGNQVARELLRAPPSANLSKSAPDTAVAHFRVFGADGFELAPEDLPVQAAARGEAVRDFEERIVFDDGIEVCLIGNATMLTDAQGQPRGSVAAFVDVTALKEVERELRELTQALEQRVEHAVGEREAVLAQLHEAQKLETLGQLTGGVAHDFNNLLTPIVGSLDMLRRRLPEDPKTTRLIDGALRAADRAQTLVARLLAFGRRQVLQARPVDVAELLRGLTDLIQRSIGQHIGVVVEPAAGLPPARVDPNQLELAILNLAVNARDAMPGGGTLTIAAHPESVGPGHEPRLTAGDYVRLSVIDTGMGMDEDTVNRAIEPFFTTKGVGKGTGLGLSMIHGLAGQLGGALKLSSTVGIGTRVDLWLPVAEAMLAPTPATVPSPMCVLPRTATVLLVDDEELVRMGAAEMLSDLGYAVIEAGSGAEAMRIVESGEQIDVLITDYLMPGMKGGELIEAARRRRPGLPSLIVSGYATIEGLPRDVPVLAKPFRHDLFAAQVAALIDPRSNVVPFSRTAGPAR